MPHRHLTKPVALLPLAMLLCLYVLTGCASMGHPIPTSGTSPACLAIKIVRFSKDDTADTKDQVRRNNSALRSMCPGL